MTTANDAVRKAGPFVGNSIVTVFAFAFKTFSAADLSVTLVTLATGVQQLLVLNTDYTVALNADQSNNPGGTVTTIGAISPIANTKTLTISGNAMADTQGTHLITPGPWNPGNVEDMVDRAMIGLQQLRDRTIKFPVIDAVAPIDLPQAETRAGRLLGFDAVGAIATFITQVGNSIVDLAAATGASLIGFIQAGVGAVKQTLQALLRERVSLKNFGAVGDGVTDDTAAFVAAYAYAQTQTFAGIAPTNVPIITAVIDIPPGDYVFNGPALNFATNSAVYFRGAGRQQTRIKLAAGIYFVNTDKLIYSAHVSGIHFTGGKGAFRYSGVANNVLGTHVYEDCYFGNYTECAIGNDATDMPYWKIHRNIFYGTITSMGVALNGLCDQTTIEDNEFQNNLIHCKLGADGAMAMIRNNDFLRFAAGGGTALTDIWLVPGSPTVGLAGTQVINNRMGNENLSAIDYRILIADEDTASGTDHLNYRPKLAVSTNWVGPLKVKDNRVAGTGAASRALITSWTKFLNGLEARNDFFGTPIQTLVFGAGVNVPSGTQSTLLNTFEASSIGGGAADQLLPEPVVPFSGVFDDPNALYQGYSSVHSYHHSGYDPSFLDLTTTDISAFTVGTGAGASVADATGNNFAVEYTVTGAGFAAFGVFAAPTANRIAYIEFDLKQGSSLPLPTLDFRISNNANLNDVAARRIIPIPAYWKRIRIPFSLPSLGATYNLASFQIQGYVAGVATKFQVARMRIYHAHEPVNLVTMGGTLNTNSPVVVTGAAYAVLPTDASIVANRAGTVTLTLPSAILNLGRELTVRTIQAQTVISAANNVVLDGGAPAAAILAAVIGKWALLKSDGSNWRIMQNN